jgi:prepilin-type N-terminal cleavage/methylation domain-containing protein
MDGTGRSLTVMAEGGAGMTTTVGGDTHAECVKTLCTALTLQRYRRSMTPAVPHAARNGRRTMSGNDDGHGTTGAARCDGGFTLIEVVIAITLMAILVVPIFSAVQTSITQSSRSRSAAQVETAIVNVADRVNRADKSCSYRPFVESAMRVQKWDPSLANVTEEHYVAAAVPSSPGQWVAGGCVADTPTDLLVQRVTIRITSPDGKASRTIQVVKSDV